jgi:hypothetical protein
MSRVEEKLAPDLFALAAAPVRPLPADCYYPLGVPVSVCDLFEKLALELHAKGHAYYSARDITARMRWHYRVDCDNREFVINNNWSPALARWFISRHPNMADFFELRASPGGED